MDMLSLLFGSTLRVKMMRLFLFNPVVGFDRDYIMAKTGARRREVEKELIFLKKFGLIKTTKIVKKIDLKKVKVTAWILVQKFKFREALSEFLIKTNPVEHSTIIKRIEKAGRIKAILLSGIFIGDPESRLDMFVVGDNITSSVINRIIKGIESDMGKDIRYSVISTPDFSYRVSMNDKLIRDVLDYPHTILLDKIGIAHS